MAYPAVDISQTHVCFEKDPGGLTRHVSSIHSASFADTVNAEIARLDGYYLACGDWLNNAAKARRIATHLQMSEADYAALALEEKYLSNHVLDRLRKLAKDKSHSSDEITQWEREAAPVNVKQIARQRMLMMQSVLHATPIIMRDPFGSGKVGEYGFGDGKTQQIFQGKAQIGDMKFSAVASPKMHDYVFRFAVCTTPKDGYVDYNPGMILDSRIVDNLESWHHETQPEQAIENNPLLRSMAQNLYPSIHDWVHSWLLYDVNAKSDSFRQWGADIFFNVDHLIKNKLIINYELLSMSLHRYVWNSMFDKDPALKDKLYQNLEDYLSRAHTFSQWVEQKQGAEEARKQEDYLAYAVLSNIAFVLDPKEPRMQAILARYPAPAAQLERILGKALALLHSDVHNMPSQAKEGGAEEFADYVMRYPMQDEIGARLKTHRIGTRSGRTVTIGGDPHKRIYEENLAEYEKLPDSIKEQIVTVRDSSTYGMLNKAIEALPEALRESFIERVQLDEAGRMFLCIDRSEVDLTRTDLRAQDKRVLLVEVPKGEKIELHPRVNVNLLEQVKRQQTIATDKEVVAFNISDPNIAEEILRAGNGADILKMIAKAKELAAGGLECADDIYPLSKEKARELYHFDKSGFYESLNRPRYAARSPGPLVMKLQDGSDQKLFDGVMVYMPFGISDFTQDTNPDLHFIERHDFLRTHKSPSGLNGIRNFALKEKTMDRYLPAFLDTLDTINRTIDHGNDESLAKGMFK